MLLLGLLILGLKPINFNWHFLRFKELCTDVKNISDNDTMRESGSIL